MMRLILKGSASTILVNTIHCLLFCIVAEHHPCARVIAGDQMFSEGNFPHPPRPEALNGKCVFPPQMLNLRGRAVVPRGCQPTDAGDSQQATRLATAGYQSPIGGLFIHDVRHGKIASSIASF
ncbi:MAG: hypothetical protein DWI22_22905 [Planctomycetota bacterium]|nr:MAG: hypothetical protein DWI22_22905 [Planctomycetota bacterium]